jgi:hypothetical protein
MPAKLGRPKRSVAARQSEHGMACKMHAVICVARRHSDLEPGNTTRQRRGARVCKGSWQEQAPYLHGIGQAEGIEKSREISKLKVRFREKAGAKMFFKC